MVSGFETKLANIVEQEASPHYGIQKENHKVSANKVCLSGRQREFSVSAPGSRGENTLGTKASSSSLTSVGGRSRFLSRAKNKK